MASGTKTGGRRKGTPNKATAAKAAEVAASGLTPLDYMLAVMRDDAADKDRRDRAAANAAPYIHPKLAAHTIAGDPDRPIVSEIRRVIVPASGNTNR